MEFLLWCALDKEVSVRSCAGKYHYSNQRITITVIQDRSKPRTQGLQQLT